MVLRGIRALCNVKHSYSSFEYLHNAYLSSQPQPKKDSGTKLSGWPLLVERLNVGGHPLFVSLAVKDLILLFASSVSPCTFCS